MNAYYKGQPVFGPRGPAGPDGNPIGTIISFMGTSTPKDYLACDGAEYSISQYPALAAFFETQFGTKNHFGGDGTTTFAVPDMRNLFLRGYHGEAEEQLSGEVGEKQEGTEFPDYGAADTMVPEGRIYIANPTPATGYHVKNTDSIYAPETRYVSVAKEFALAPSNNERYAEWFTSRPVNMAVLYCIKAAESVPGESVYSTEEIRVGTWIDGKPLYQITKTGMLSSESVNAYAPPIGFAFSEQIDYPIYLEASIYNGTIILFGEQGSIESIAWNRPNNRIEVYLSANTYVDSVITCTIRYTKPTDQPTIELPAAVAGEPAQTLYKAAPRSVTAVTLDSFTKNEEL